MEPLKPDPSENWIPLKTKHLVFVLCFPLYIKVNIFSKYRPLCIPNICGTVRPRKYIFLYLPPLLTGRQNLLTGKSETTSDSEDDQINENMTESISFNL